jgi:hypothetical protein
MPIGPTFCGDILKLVFEGVAIANIADNTATTPSTAIWLALHTAQPSSDAQTGSEAAYTGYTRISVDRSTAGTAFTYVAASSAGAGANLYPAATITFPIASGSSEVETHFSAGLSSAGVGKIEWSGTLSPTISVLNGVTPRLTTGTAINLA